MQFLDWKVTISTARFEQQGTVLCRAPVADAARSFNLL